MAVRALHTQGAARALAGSTRLEEPRSDQMSRGCSVTVLAHGQTGFAPSTSRLADLMVNRDLLKTTMEIKNVDVRASTTRHAMPDAYAPCHAPLWDPVPSHYMHHPNQSATKDSCLVEEGCLNGLGIRKVISRMISQCTAQSIVNMRAWSMSGRCIVCASCAGVHVHVHVHAHMW